MKRMFMVSAILCFLTLSNSTYSQWVTTNGPWGGQIGDVVSAGGKLFAAVMDSGIVMSADNGVSWNLSSFKNNTISAFASNGSKLCVGTYTGKLFLSTDYGTTWNSINNALPTAFIKSVFLTEDTIYVGFLGQGVYYSKDLGTTWQTMNSPLNESSIYSFAASGTNIYAGGKNLFAISNDNGNTWSQSAFSKPVTSVYVLNNIVLAGTDGEGIYYSNDSGATWNKAVTPVNNAIVYAFIIKDNVFLAATTLGIYKSINNGVDWTVSNTGLNCLWAYSFALHNGSIYTGTSCGLFKSANNGDNWIHSSEGTVKLSLYSLTAFDNTLYAGSNNYGLFVSTDSGNNWISQSNGLAGKTISCVSKNNDIICAGTTDSGLFLSTDNGNNFAPISTNAASYNINVTCVEYSNGNIIMGADGGIFFSPNLGGEWTLINSGALNQGVRTFLKYGNKVIAGTVNGTVYSSLNNGETWTAGGSIASSPIYSFTVNGTNLFAGTGKGVYLSTNEGVTWTAATSGIPENTSIISLAAKNDHVYALSYWGTVYISVNNGTSWNAYDNVTRPHTYGLTILGDYIYSGTSLGVWKRPISDVVGITEEENVFPNDILQIQNYPNPFNPATKIKYSISKPGHVQIKIYNSLSQELLTIVNDYKAVGSYEIEFNAANLPSGIYFATINQTGNVKALKMNLVK